MTRKILCQHCQKPIPDRKSLSVVGRGLHPLHTQCLPAYAAQQPWYQKPGWPINRWRSLFFFNAVLLLLILGLHLTIAPLTTSEWAGLGRLLLFINGGLLVPRFISYLSYERHLPTR